MDRQGSRATGAERTSKRRAAQACENCRRKKSRCNGALPQCSLCGRLGQECIYATSPRKKRVHSGPRKTNALHGEHAIRLSAIEERLDQISSALTTGVDDDFVTEEIETTPTDDRDHARNAIVDQDLRQDTSPLTSASWQERVPQQLAAQAIECYFRHFDCQPYPLLSHLAGNILPHPQQLPTVVIDALLCLTLPLLAYSTALDLQAAQELAARCEDSAWSILCDRYKEMSFDDEYFQALCLLAQSDLARCKTHRAQAQVTLGLRVAELTSLVDLEPSDTTVSQLKPTRSAIFWTLFMLDRMIGSGKGSSVYSPAIYSIPVYQYGPLRPDSSQSACKPFTLNDTIATRGHTPSRSVTAVTIELLDIWGLVVSHIFSNPRPEDVPFWQYNSPRARLATRLLEFELKVELHSYASTGAPSRVLAEPQLRRYYAARFFLHMLHTGTLCCLNHPFIVYTSTHHLKGRVPRSYLQNSYKICTINANWVVMLLKDMERSRISLYDPFLGYLVTIAATIHLDKSLRKNDDSVNSASQDFQLCYDFVRKMASVWPSLKNVLQVLDKLNGLLKQGPALDLADDDYDARVRSNNANEIMLPEEISRTMWSLFDYAAVSSGRGQQTATVASPLDSSMTLDAVVNVAEGPSTVDHDANAWGEMPDFDNFMGMENEWLLFGKPWTAYFPTQEGLYEQE